MNGFVYLLRITFAFIFKPSTMKKLLLLLLFVTNSFAQNGTEIFLCDFSEENGNIILTNPKNITEREGYDNQPFFHPSKDLIYYSARENDQTDIWAYNFKTGAKTKFTNSIDSEYSPTIIPGAEYLSCIVQRKNTGYQDLVIFPLQKSTTSEIILKSEEVGRVGYQAWMTDNTFITFILGEPHKLYLRDLKSKSETLIATKINRSLHKIPSQNSFSFVQEVDNKSIIKSFDLNTKQIKTITESNVDSEHFNVWTESGVLLESYSSGIRFFRNSSQKWDEVDLPSNLPKKRISRMAIKDHKIALVLEE
jgi:hypothetical protein